MIELTGPHSAGEQRSTKSLEIKMPMHSSNGEVEQNGDNFSGTGVILEPAVDEVQRWNKPAINVYR
jgi:hypothetical protein